MAQAAQSCAMRQSCIADVVIRSLRGASGSKEWLVQVIGKWEPTHVLISGSSGTLHNSISGTWNSGSSKQVCRHFASTAPSSRPQHQQGTRPLLSSTQPSGKKEVEREWRQHTNSNFSIRPSLLSPLYTAYQNEAQKHQRAQIVSQLLEAHTLLATEIDGLDTYQVEQTAQHRAVSLSQLGSELKALANRQTIASCTDRSTMLGFYSMLDKQAAAGSSNQQASVTGSTGTLFRSPQQSANSATDNPTTDAGIYQEIESGKVPVYDAWLKHFVDRYQGTPSLEPLEVIYANASQSQASRDAAQHTQHAELLTLQEAAQNLADQRRKQHRLDELYLQGQDVTEQPDVLGFGYPVWMDEDGWAHASGKRKSSIAKVRLCKGHGLITVNGQPYDEYFKDVQHRLAMLQPLLMVPNASTTFNCQVEVQQGYGKSSEAQAVRNALARALLLFPEKLTDETRPVAELLAKWDRRRAERNKTGRYKARKGHTYVRR